MRSVSPNSMADRRCGPFSTSNAPDTPWDGHAHRTVRNLSSSDGPNSTSISWATSSQDSVHRRRCIDARRMAASRVAASCRSSSIDANHALARSAAQVDQLAAPVCVAECRLSCRSVRRPPSARPATKAQPLAHRPGAAALTPESGTRPQFSRTHLEESTGNQTWNGHTTPGTEPGTQPGTGTNTRNRTGNETGNLDKVRHVIPTPTLHLTFSLETTPSAREQLVTRRRREARRDRRRDSSRRCAPRRRSRRRSA